VRRSRTTLDEYGQKRTTYMPPIADRNGRHVVSDGQPKDLYDRKERRAIGHFIEMADKQFEKEKESGGESASYRGVIKELQRRHDCHD
jgi:hypothetical protein